MCDKQDKKTKLLEDIDKTCTIYKETKGISPNRALLMMEQYGKVEAISRLVRSPNLQDGFKFLKDKGKLDKTFEAVVLKHSELFSEEVVKMAKWRLDNADNLPED